MLINFLDREGVGEQAWKREATIDAICVLERGLGQQMMSMRGVCGQHEP